MKNDQFQVGFAQMWFKLSNFYCKKYKNLAFKWTIQTNNHIIKKIYRYSVRNRVIIMLIRLSNLIWFSVLLWMVILSVEGTVLVAVSLYTFYTSKADNVVYNKSLSIKKIYNNMITFAICTQNIYRKYNIHTFAHTWKSFFSRLKNIVKKNPRKKKYRISIT